VAVLVIGRIGWLIVSPPPDPLAPAGSRDHRIARVVHLGLYAALLAFPVSGYLLRQGGSADFYGWAVPTPEWAAAAELALIVHAWVLPALFYTMVALHLAAVAKRHFADRDTGAVRRMLR
jgi:cytochrome b561